MAHSCPACSQELRELYAAARSLLDRPGGVYVGAENTAALGKYLARIDRLQGVVSRLAPIMDAHFEAVDREPLIEAA